MTLRIRIDHGQDAGKTWRLSRPGIYMMGRFPEATLQVLDMKVSKDHCKITLKGEGDAQQVVLRDLESRHGTLVNGQPVTGKVRITPGDEIRVGLSILRVLSDGEADVDAEPVSDAGEPRP